MDVSEFILVLNAKLLVMIVKKVISVMIGIYNQNWWMIIKIVSKIKKIKIVVITRLAVLNNLILDVSDIFKVLFNFQNFSKNMSILFIHTTIL